MTPAGKIHSKEFAAAVAVTVVVNVNSVVVPMNFDTSVILVVVTPLVKTNVAGTVGNALVNDKAFAAKEVPTPFTALTEIAVVPTPGATPAKLTVIIFEVPPEI